MFVPAIEFPIDHGWIQDLEEIEEWNEFGELRMQVNSVEDLDSFPSTATATATVPEGAGSTTATAAPPSEPTATATPENPPPKQSTIKIQSPPAKETKKDESVTAAMRQAGEAAASKAKGGGDSADTKESKPETQAESTAPEETEKKPETKKESEQPTGEKPEETENVCRKSTSPTPEIAGNVEKRPPLAIVPEVAAESSDNFHADNVEALGLVEHHRGSIISATSEEEKTKVARDLRQSVSGARGDVVDALRNVDVDVDVEGVMNEAAVDSEDKDDHAQVTQIEYSLPKNTSVSV